MKFKPETWCKIQEMLANLKCPGCFSAKVELTEDCEENAACGDCGCTFTFDPDVVPDWQ
jgi:hypothetical protein